MKTSISTAGFALASAAFLLAACGTTNYAQYGYSNQYSYNENRDAYYDIPYFYSSNYNNCYRYTSCYRPTYSGTVVIGGTSYAGLPYRDGPEGSQVWLDDKWASLDQSTPGTQRFTRDVYAR